MIGCLTLDFKQQWGTNVARRPGSLTLTVKLYPRCTSILFPSSCCYARVKDEVTQDSYVLTCSACDTITDRPIVLPTFNVSLSPEDKSVLLPLLTDAIAHDPDLSSVLESDMIGSYLVPKLARWIDRTRKASDLNQRRISAQTIAYLSHS